MRNAPSAAAMVICTVILGIEAIVGSAASLDAAGPRQATPPPRRSSCVPSSSKYAEPGVVLRGEPVAVTLRATILCPGERWPLHMMLVLDASGSMAGARTRVVKDEAIRFVRRFDLPRNPHISFGVVEYNHEARVLAGLTNDEGLVIAAIDVLGASGGTRLDLGIRAATEVLVDGRSGAPGGDQDQAREAMVALSDGAHASGCQPVTQAAVAAKSQGILLSTICLGNECDAMCMRNAATAPRHYYDASTESDLGAVFDHIRATLLDRDIAVLSVTDTIPDNMAYVPGSAEPEPKVLGSVAKSITWEIDSVPREGVTLTLQVEPLAPGTWPTNLEATGVFTDALGFSGSFMFAVPEVQVFEPGTLPTAPVTPTRAATIGPPETPTPVSGPEPVYLPSAYSADS